jgi:hypothetical protein
MTKNKDVTVNDIKYIKSMQMGADGLINAFLIFVEYENQIYCEGFTMKIDDWDYEDNDLSKEGIPKRTFLEMTIKYGNKVEDFIALVKE